MTKIELKPKSYEELQEVIIELNTQLVIQNKKIKELKENIKNAKKYINDLPVTVRWYNIRELQEKGVSEYTISKIFSSKVNRKKEEGCFIEINVNYLEELLDGKERY